MEPEVCVTVLNMTLPLASAVFVTIVLPEWVGSLVIAGSDWVVDDEDVDEELVEEGKEDEDGDDRDWALLEPLRPKPEKTVNALWPPHITRPKPLQGTLQFELEMELLVGMDDKQ